MDMKIVALDKAMFVLPQKTKDIRVLKLVLAAKLLTIIAKTIS